MNEAFAAEDEARAAKETYDVLYEKLKMVWHGRSALAILKENEKPDFAHFERVTSRFIDFETPGASDLLHKKLL